MSVDCVGDSHSLSVHAWCHEVKSRGKSVMSFSLRVRRVSFLSRGDDHPIRTEARSNRLDASLMGRLLDEVLNHALCVWCSPH